MRIISSIRKTFWFVIVIALSYCITQPFVYADMVSTEQLVAQAQVDSKRAEIFTMLEREEIRARVVDMGVDLTDAQNRINSMTDSELNQVYANLNTLPADGDALGAVLTILLIFLILDLADVTDVFPGV